MPTGFDEQIRAACRRLFLALREANPGFGEDRRLDRLAALSSKVLNRAVVLRRCRALGIVPAHGLEPRAWAVLVDAGWLEHDPELDSLDIPNQALDSLELLARFDDLIRVFEIAVADFGRLSSDPGQVSKRKRDGVFYSPAWVTRYIVEAVVGERLRMNPELLATITIVDPSCGAGAFLLAAFEYLLEQRRRLAAELGEPFDATAAARAIIEHNLHGVDQSPEAVEHTRLALRLRAASLEPALVELCDNIRCGDALDARGFAWDRAFAPVFLARDPGFDCVIGNPPYIKLQHFRRIREDVADYLISARNDDGSPRYQSTQTGNFDLYLPFIENGVMLLNRSGLLGYLAPSAWLSSEYGEGLRRFVRSTRSLDRWIDFEDHQVFADATTYTAIQVFSGRPRPAIRCAFAPGGPADLAGLDWASHEYEKLAEQGAWRLMPPAKQALWSKLRARCRTLGEVCEQISVGVQTSADHIYHLERVGPRRYRRRAGLELELEDEIMRPLLSGAEVNRYERPRTSTYLLFPYARSRLTLIPADEMSERFPLAWAYLRDHEPELRARERGKMDRDDRWWGYNYPKNLAKQHLPKLVVAQTVPSLRVAYDVDGHHCLNNVRVNGVFTATAAEAWFLLAILNGPVADFVFRAIAKRKAGGYFEANKQYIAPLPIPAASPEQQAVAAAAERLQELHTRLADAEGNSAEVEAAIAAAERELDSLIYQLYDLTDAEVRLIEAGRRRPASHRCS